MNRLLPFSLLLCVVLACANSERPATVAPQSSPTATEPDTPTNNEAQRLARAADVRRHIGEVANVVAHDRILKVYYKHAHADYMDYIFQGFCNGENIKDLLTAGFETVEIHADDSFGKTQRKAFPLKDCESVKM